MESRPTRHSACGLGADLNTFGEQHLGPEGTKSVAPPCLVDDLGQAIQGLGGGVRVTVVEVGEGSLPLIAGRCQEGPEEAPE